MRIPFRYSFQSLWSRRTSMSAAAVGIGLVVFVLAASQMLAEGVRRTFSNTGKPHRAMVFTNTAYSEGDSRLRQSVVGLVAAAPGVKRSSDGARVAGEVVMQLWLRHANDQERVASVRVRGVTKESLLVRPEVRVVTGRAAKPGTDEAMIGVSLVGRYQGLALGQRFDIKKNRSLVVVGVFESEGSALESEVWGDIDAVRSAFGYEGYLSSITAELESPASFGPFELALERDKRQGLAVLAEPDYFDRVSEGLSRMLSGLGEIIALIVSFGAMLGAAVTMHGAMSRRRREIGVLRAIGFRPSVVLATFLLETLVVSLFGACMGIVLAAFTSYLDFSTNVYATGNEVTFHFQPNAAILVHAILAGTVVGMLGGVFPAVGAARTSPISAMRLS